MASRPASEIPVAAEHRKSLALEFLNSQAFHIAEDKFREKILIAWENTIPPQKEEREELWYMLKTFNTMKGEVKKILDNAEFDQGVIRETSKNTQ